MRRLLDRIKQRLQPPITGTLHARRAVYAVLAQGLSNQMAIYRTARMLARENNSTLILDASWYAAAHARSDRSLQLTHYPIQYDLLTDSPAFRQWFAAQHPEAIHLGHPQRESLSAAGHMDCAKKADVLIMDFWCADKLRREVNVYFDAENLLSELQLPESELGVRDRQLLRKIEAAGNPVALHVRRGDFSWSDGGMLLPAERYNEQIAAMETRHAGASFYVFSDDIGWCREHLSAQQPLNFVDWNDEHHGYRDLFLASQCRHFILSNESTFSHQFVQLSPHKSTGEIVKLSVRD